jgi:hypothetical protein
MNYKLYTNIIYNIAGSFNQLDIPIDNLTHATLAKVGSNRRVSTRKTTVSFTTQ